MKRILILANALLMISGSAMLYADETGGGQTTTDSTATTTQTTSSSIDSCSWLDMFFGNCDE